MSEKREMTPKGFLHKSKIAKSVAGFLKANRDYLTTGELAPLTSPILRQIDERTILETEGLNKIREVVFRHMMEVETRKAEASLNKPVPSTEPKDFVATVRNEAGDIMTKLNEKNEEIDLYKEFDKPGDAERWVMRRLDEGAPDWHGEIQWLKCPEKLPDVTIITRDEAINAIHNPHKVGTVMHKTKTSGNLSNKMRARGDHAHFSHG